MKQRCKRCGSAEITKFDEKYRCVKCEHTGFVYETFYKILKPTEE